MGAASGGCRGHGETGAGAAAAVTTGKEEKRNGRRQIKEVRKVGSQKIKEAKNNKGSGIQQMKQS